MEWDKSKLEREIQAGKYHHANPDSATGLYHLITANTGIIQANEREIIELSKTLSDMGPAPKGVEDSHRTAIVDRLSRLRAHNDDVRNELGRITAKISGNPYMPPGPPIQAEPAVIFDPATGRLVPNPKLAGPAQAPAPTKERKVATRPPYRGPSANPNDEGNFSVSDAVASSMGLGGLRRMVDAKKKPNIMTDPITSAVIDLPEDKQNLIRYQ